MSGRFPLYTDEDLYGPIVDGLIHAGWDVLRAIDAHPEGTDDDVHFETAAKAGRVLVAHDRHQIIRAKGWTAQGRAFPGLITWQQRMSRRFPVSAFLEAFEDLAGRAPFAVTPVVFLKPRC